MLSNGEIPENLKLVSRKDYEVLGEKLYSLVSPKVREQVFVRQYSGKRLNDPDENDGGQPTLGFVLPLYVGVNRDKILAEVEKHYTTLNRKRR